MDAGAEDGANASRSDPRLGMDALCRSAGVLEIDVLRRDLYIVQGGVDIGMAHQLHESGKADTGPRHIRSEGMPEAMRVSDLYARGAAMMAEQGA